MTHTFLTVGTANKYKAAAAGAVDTSWHIISPPNDRIDQLYDNTPTITRIEAVIKGKVRFINPAVDTVVVNGTTYAAGSDVNTVYDALLPLFLKANTGAGGTGVTSVNTRTGDVTLSKSDVSLGNVDNTSDSSKPVSTAQATADSNILASAKTYADGLVVGLWDDRGSFSAAANTYPTTGGSGTSGAIKKGDIWTISADGTLGGKVTKQGDTLRALVDTPGSTASNWNIQPTAIGYVPENATNKDATDGYVGLTALKINFWNALGTVKSFFTNAATAVRTYTFPNKDITVAGISDITDAVLSTTDVTTNDVSTSKHGFAPKLPNDATKFLDGTGAYNTPPTALAAPFALQGQGTNNNPSANAIYYIGSLTGQTSNPGQTRLYFPATGKITKVIVFINTGSSGSTTEISTISLRLNNATDYAVYTGNLGGSATAGVTVNQKVSNTSMNSSNGIAVTGDTDYCELKVAWPPSMVTFPQSVRYSFIVWVTPS